MKNPVALPHFEIYLPRRHFLRQVAFGSALFAVPVYQLACFAYLGAWRLAVRRA